MKNKFVSVLGPIAVAALALGAGTVWAYVAPRPAPGTLASKEFFKPELHISSSNVGLNEAFATLGNKSAWGRFQAIYGQAQVYLDPRSGTATSIATRIPMIPGKGDRNALSLSDVSSVLGRKVDTIDKPVVAELMRRFVVDNAEAIGIDATQIGPVKAEPVNDRIWNVSIPQMVEGIPVRYSHLVAVINSGNLTLMGTETWGNVRIDTNPSITATQALGIGFGYAGGWTLSDDLWKKPELEIVPIAPQKFQVGESFSGPTGVGYDHRLVWSFGIQRKGDDGRYEVLVDAHTGEVISFEDKNLYEAKKITGGIYPLSDTEICPSNDRCGTMQLDYPMPFADTGLASPNDFTNSAGVFNYTSGTATTHLQGKYVSINDFFGALAETGPGSIALGGANGQHDGTSAGASPGDTASSRSAFYELNKLIEQARGWLPSNVWLQSQLITNVNLDLTCNAFYSTLTGQVNFYQSGGGCRNTGEIAAVFDHEWGHGMDDNDTGGELSNTSEAYADINAILRLQGSCVGYGFWWTADQGCGTTSDGTGFNGDESQVATTHCELDCSGVRGADWDKHFDHNPDTPANFVCGLCNPGGGPCGREAHCEAAPSNQTAWDLAARDLQAPPFNYSQGDAFLIADKLFYQGSGLIGNWETCTCPSTSNGCGATNAYLQWLAADDDNGNLNDGTPHMSAIFAAFDRHGIACATPTVQNSGCAGGPMTAPNLTIATGSNSLGLSWSAVAGASTYRILRSEGYGGCNFGKAVIAQVAGTTYTDNDVANGRTYSYVVQAVGGIDACFGPGSTCTQGTPQPCAGSISLTQDIYNCGGGQLHITLTDGDLAGQGTQAVSISSNTEHGPETLVLNENPANPGAFTGTFNTTTAPPVGGDGAISISDGDTIAVDYLDASYCGTPNVTVSKFATVDCSPPLITNVQITNVGGTNSDVTFTTNEPTDATAHFGTTPPPGSQVHSGTLGTSHTVHLSGLTNCTAYVVSVDATDAAGNSSSDNNAGAYYGFITYQDVAFSFPYSGPPVVINDLATSTASISVADSRVVEDVNVKVDQITHTYDGDLSLTLIAPNGTRVLLSNQHGTGGDNYTSTVFDDEAATPITSGTPPYTGSFQPEQPLSAVDGIAANGTWSLEVQDHASQDTGFINAWQVQLTFAAPCPTVGQVTFDADAYGCTQTPQIKVVDLSIVGAGTQPVTIVSNTEVAGETIVLTETPANSGTFLGGIPLVRGAVVSNDGNLTVSDGDTITVTYIDADDGYGGHNIPRTDAASISCAANAQAGPHTAADTCGGAAGNNIADPGEDLSLPVQVSNTGTVPLTNVTATLTSPTANVVMLVGSSSYGTLAVGQTAPGSVPFKASIGSSVPCGTLITFNLHIISDQGAFNDSFTVQTGVLPVPTTNYPSTDTPKPIPDDRTPRVSPIVVANPGVVQDVNVTVNINHTFDGDLILVLIGPNGTRVSLSNRRGSLGDNYTNTVFDDSAATSITAGSPPFTGTFLPEDSLATLNGIPGNGTWGLEITDAANLDSGTLLNWTLTITAPGAYQCTACSLSAPGEANNLSFTDRTTVTYSSVAGASGYFLYSGATADLPSLLNGSNDSCLRASGVGTTLSGITHDPPAGNLDWYLIRAYNSGGYGPAGNATAGPRIQNSSGTCP